VTGKEALVAQIHSQATRVGRRLRRSGMKARVVQLTIKYADFTVITRRTTLEAPTDDGQTLYREACTLLDRVDLRRSIRLTGVSAQSFTGGREQLGLFADPGPSRTDKLNAALDKISSKFGSAAIATADLKDDAPESEETERIRREMGAARRAPGDKR
jgi:DNA polymerase-4